MSTFDSRAWDWNSNACAKHPDRSLPCQRCIESNDMDLFRPNVLRDAKAAFAAGFGYVIENATPAEMEMLDVWRGQQIDSIVREPTKRMVENRIRGTGVNPVLIALPTPREVMALLTRKYDLFQRDDETLVVTQNPCGEIPLGTTEPGAQFQSDVMTSAQAGWLLGEDNYRSRLLSTEEHEALDSWIDDRIADGSVFGCMDPKPDPDRIRAWSGSHNPVIRAQAAYIQGHRLPTLTTEQRRRVDFWIARRARVLGEMGRGDGQNIPLPEIEPTDSYLRGAKAVAAAMKVRATYPAVVLQGPIPYKIVDGRERVAAARYLEWTTIKARVIGTWKE